MKKVPLKITYGIMAAIDLGLHYGSQPIQAKIIAGRQAIPVRFIEQVLYSLKQAGVVESARGAQGGYSLRKDPSQISLAEIVEAMDGQPRPAAYNPIMRNGKADILVDSEKFLSGIWKKVHQAEQKVLRSITLNALVEQYAQLEHQQALMYHI